MSSGAGFAGLGAPLVLVAYLIYAERIRTGYDATREYISDLGDGIDGAAGGFVFANIAVGGLLGYFAWEGLDHNFEPLVAVAVGVAAVGSLVIALTPCRLHCRLPYCVGRPINALRHLHIGFSALNLGILVGLPVAVRLQGTPEPAGWQFHWVNNLLSVATPAVAVGALALGFIGKRQRKNRRESEQPWVNPDPFLARGGSYERLVLAFGYTWVVAAATSEQLLHRWCLPLSLTWLGASSIGALAPRKVGPLEQFDIATCQENTIYGLSDSGHGTFLLLEIDKGDQGEQFLTFLGNALRDGVIKGEASRERKRRQRAHRDREYTVTIGFSRAGLKKLDVPYVWRDARPDAFGEGMGRRKDHLGDDAHWSAAGEPSVDVVLWIYARHVASLAEARASLGKCGEMGARELRSIDTKRRERSLEPFGFRDGISQPWVARVPMPSNDRDKKRRNKELDPRGGGKIHGRTNWRPIALGEFILGQVDESRDVFAVPEPASLFLGGTFAVIREIDQDADGFARIAGTSRGVICTDEIAEKLVGRKTDGTPLIKRDTNFIRWLMNLLITRVKNFVKWLINLFLNRKPEEKSPPRPDNRFRYGEDPYGVQCPLTAHIRRANPRDSMGFDSALVNRHRIIRRGMPYADRDGLMFVGFNVRILDQFEFIQTQWLNNGRSLGLGSTPDLVAGQWTRDQKREVVLTTPDGPVIVSAQNPYVRTRGGEYVLVPSLRGLRYLAKRAWAVTSTPEHRSADGPDAVPVPAAHDGPHPPP
jgi:Dyp-type peroxidase family